jgi:hypothetical protein
VREKAASSAEAGCHRRGNMPKKIRCRGSGQKVDGQDEPTGTVQCGVCGNNTLYMQRAVDGEGKEPLSIPSHDRVVYPARRPQWVYRSCTVR